MVDEAVEVSVILPCLNEEGTLASCIRAAQAALDEAGLSAEIIVADNGSSDRSPEIAVEEGARLVPVASRGYGNALYNGFRAARGRYLIHLDADMSYEFAHIPRFVDKLREGADLVMGSRMRGTIYPGAMPFLHRYLGTPVLTTLANLFFKCGITDINCGMRGLKKNAFERMGLTSGGMEFASEMVVKTATLGMKIVEVPTDLKPDERSRRPHLSSFRDGWRHLRFLLLYAPTWLFVLPGLLATLGGTVVIGTILFGLSSHFGVFTCLVALAATVLGVQTTLLGLATRGFAQFRRLQVEEKVFNRMFSGMTLEKGIILGSLLAVSGVVTLGVSCWRIVDFMNTPTYVPLQFDLPSTKLALLGTTLFVTGSQIVFSSFFLGLFSIEGLSHEPGAGSTGATSLNLNLVVPRPKAEAASG